MGAAYVAPQTALAQLSNFGLTPEGRLTLTSAVPVLSTDVSASATVYYTPYQGSLVPIYDGTRFVARVFTELSNVLANAATGNAGPAAGAAAKNYDLFVWDNAGTLTLTRGAAWNSDTVRSSTTENDLQMVSGVLTNLNAITNGPGVNKGTYVGTVMTDAGAATVSVLFGGTASGGSQAWFGVWNAYNQKEFRWHVRDSAALWTYSSQTVRPANNSATNRATFVRGLNEDWMQAEYSNGINTAAVAVSFGLSLIGLDATNAQATDSVSAKVICDVTSVASPQAVGASPSARYSGLPGLGKHFLSACEAADGTNNASFGAPSASTTVMLFSGAVRG